MSNPRGPFSFTALGALFACAALAPVLAGDEEGALRGVARNAQGPVAGADVESGIIGWAPAAGDRVAAATTDEEGRFALTGAPLGPCDVWVRPKGGKWTFAIRMWHPGVNDLAVDAREKRGIGDFGMGAARSGTVAGTVTDKQGKALAGAAVGLRGDDSTWVRTDEKGQFTLEKAGEGDGLVARADGFRDAIVEKVKLDKKRMSIKLAAVKPTVVHVTDPAGQPLAGAWVVLGDPDRVQGTTGFTSLFPPRPRLVGGWTDAKGDVRVAWGDTEDKTVATAYARNFAPASKGIVAGGAVVNLQLAAPRPMRATVTFRDSGNPIPGVQVGLPHESDGGADAISALPQDAERGPVVVGVTDDNGQCVIPHLDAKVTTLRVVGEMKLKAAVKLEPVSGAK